MKYVTLGSLTHGSRFAPSYHPLETPWVVVRQVESWTFARRLGGMVEPVMLSANSMVVIDPMFGEAQEGPPCLDPTWQPPWLPETQADDDLAVDLYMEEQREADEAYMIRLEYEADREE